MSQPEALRLANDLDRGWAYKTECAETAAELRRLSNLVMDMQGEIYALGMARSMEKKIAELSFNALEKQRDELLLALKKARAEFDGLPRSLGYEFTHLPDIDAVIKKAEEA